MPQGVSEVLTFPGRGDKRMFAHPAAAGLAISAAGSGTSQAGHNSDSERQVDAEASPVPSGSRRLRSLVPVQRKIILHAPLDEPWQQVDAGDPSLADLGH